MRIVFNHIDEVFPMSHFDVAKDNYWTMSGKQPVSNGVSKYLMNKKLIQVMLIVFYHIDEVFFLANHFVIFMLVCLVRL